MYPTELETQPSAAGPALGPAAGGSVGAWVCRRPRDSPERMRRKLAILVLWLLSCGATSAQPSFEVVSVKAVPDADGVAITPRRSGSRITYTTQLRMAVYYAYRVAPYQVIGELPGEIYDIEAVADTSPTDDQLRLMFQSLLRERFKLKIHNESRNMQGYELLVAKNGPKLDPARDNSHIEFDGRDAPEGAGSYATRSGPRLLGRRSSMGQLADALARNLRLPVMDRTGLSGVYDFNVAFSREEAVPDANAADVAPPPLLPIALREQLGLRLQPAKVPVTMLIIDHAEPPTPN